jgi:hypothetical protein
MMGVKDSLRVKANRRKSRAKAILPGTLIRGAKAVELLPHVSNQSTWARQWRKTQNCLAVDRGGWEVLSEAERIEIAHAATLHTELTLLISA